MAIIERRFTYRGTIGLTTSDLQLVREGRKTCTVRLGELDVADRDIWLSDRRSRVKVEVTRVENKRRFGDLTEADARFDGQPTLEAMSADLAKFYGAIEPAQPITVIWFRLKDEPFRPSSPLQST